MKGDRNKTMTKKDCEGERGEWNERREGKKPD
jgi:hypothetical protein